MIIWINGAFGSGKTTIAEFLNNYFDLSFLYDPENIGGFFKHNLPDSIQHCDFQDYPEWRKWNVQILEKLHHEYHGDIIVPMCLYKSDIFDDIIGELKRKQIPLQHFQLEVSKKILIERLQKRSPDIAEWGKNRINEILETFNDFPIEDKVFNENRTVLEVSTEIIEKLNSKEMKQLVR
ncbi:deoxyadenosine/deoxycytidine kinase [Enterococcus sp. PF1-24]|uniref:AAA family ATPase n=1 Tax=unclassified Enterococcus TaxID=2608891 RepID=UPI0024758B26|nr:MULTISPECIES: AAA family ATPase [unclassified Enterococcus]MDH6364129.1 deoxyadenosine/deoxycytidine kinase [Enterococcus sp. PFB1-1]MDH6401230.1 deoxyadenosine/deoxycytidine kinase [Enterococcus sp. PF1-24]